MMDLAPEDKGEATDKIVGGHSMIIIQHLLTQIGVELEAAQN